MSWNISKSFLTSSSPSNLLSRRLEEREKIDSDKRFRQLAQECAPAPKSNGFGVKKFHHVRD